MLRNELRIEKEGNTFQVLPVSQNQYQWFRRRKFSTIDYEILLLYKVIDNELDLTLIKNANKKRL